MNYRPLANAVTDSTFLSRVEEEIVREAPFPELAFPPV